MNRIWYEHAALFAESLLNVLYQPTEPAANMRESVRSWTPPLANGVVNPPIALDVIDPNAESLLPELFRNGGTDVMV